MVKNMDIPTSLVISYAVFSFFLFYQQLHIKNFHGASQAFAFALNIFAFAGMLFAIGFLLYWGFSVSWWQALLLFGVSFLVKIIWFPLEAKLGLTRFYWLFSLGGFAVLPISGFFMLSALP